MVRAVLQYTPCVLLLAAHVALAGTTGKIAGKIIDAATKEPLVGVSVLLEGTKLGASTDVDGLYAIINIPPGTYTVVASAIGYHPSRIT
ncbi:MAG TPA: carboxypeptidase-like regulatory domain-containing protein, partial [Bacteroidota bacterium]|nr:carboxypeptidase-like regulatory domain-containing protein [Bacteroidota bacterium]